jgi:hypothetical protein
MEPVKEYKKYLPTLARLLDGSHQLTYYIYDGSDFKKIVVNIPGESEAKIEREHQESLLVLGKLQRFINQKEHMKYSVLPIKQESFSMAIKELQTALKKLYPHKISVDRCRYYLQHYLLPLLQQIEFRANSTYKERQEKIAAFLLSYANGEFVNNQKAAA